MALFPSFKKCKATPHTTSHIIIVPEESADARIKGSCVEKSDKELGTDTDDTTFPGHFT